MKVIVLLTSGKSSAEVDDTWEWRLLLFVSPYRCDRFEGTWAGPWLSGEGGSVAATIHDQQLLNDAFEIRRAPAPNPRIATRLSGRRRTHPNPYMDECSILTLLGGKGDAVPASTDWRTRGIQPADGTPTRGPLKLVAGSCTQTWSRQWVPAWRHKCWSLSLVWRLKKSRKYVEDAVEISTMTQVPLSTDQTTKSKSYLIPVLIRLQPNLLNYNNGYEACKQTTHVPICTTKDIPASYIFLHPRALPQDSFEDFARNAEFDWDATDSVPPFEA